MTKRKSGIGGNAGTDARAIRDAKSRSLLPGRQPIGGEPADSDRETSERTQSKRPTSRGRKLIGGEPAVAGRATFLAKPTTRLPGQQLHTATGDGGGTADQATVVSKPVCATPGRPTQTASGGGDDRAHPGCDTQGTPSPVIAEIIQLWRMRQRWHRAEKSLILQAKAICRSFCGGDKDEANKLYDKIENNEPVDDPRLIWALSPFLISIQRFRKGEPLALLSGREMIEKQLAKLAKSLPIWAAWGEGIHGFGPMGLASIVGEAGDIGSYSNPAKLWKRMGLAVIHGERQRCKSDVDEAAEHGYNPARRSTMWNVGGSLIGGMGKGPRPAVGEDIEQRLDWSNYQRLFVRILRAEVQRTTETWDGPKHVREPVLSKKTGEMHESFSAHAAARCKRRVEKQFLCDLLVAWRAAADQPCFVSHNVDVSGGQFLQAAE